MMMWRNGVKLKTLMKDVGPDFKCMKLLTNGELVRAIIITGDAWRPIKMGDLQYPDRQGRKLDPWDYYQGALESSFGPEIVAYTTICKLVAVGGDLAKASQAAYVDCLHQMNGTEPPPF